MLGIRNGEKPVEQVRCWVAGQVEVEPVYVFAYVDVLHEALRGQQLDYSLEPVIYVGQKRPAVRDDPGHLRVADDHAVCDKVQDRAGRVGDELEQRHGACGKHVFLYRLGSVGMDGANGPTLVQRLHERVELGISKVEAAAVAREFDAVRPQGVKRVPRLCNRRFNIG